MRRFHKMSSAVECQVCNEILSNKQNLKTHQKLKHLNNVMSLLCGKCDQQFLRKQNYERHITSCHQDSPEYVCKVCRKSFTSKRA